jgi:peptidoglycan/LPS O-acetylase OafA/YrhL
VPPYYLLLAVTWLVGIAVVQETFFWHVFYLSNVKIALTNDWHGPVAHLWTLAVEEQFYLFWPWLILFFPRRHLMKMIVATIAIAPISRIVGTVVGVPPIGLSVLPFGCLDTLGAGALLAVCRESSFGFTRLGPRLEILGFRVGLPLFLFMVLATQLHQASLIALPNVYGVSVDGILRALGDTSTAAWGLWLVGRASTGFAGAGRAALEWAPVVYLGSISYGMYLVHNFLPLLPILPQPTDGVSQFVRLVLLIAIDVAIASVSWYALERPLATLKQRLSSPLPRASVIPRSVVPRLPRGSWLPGH